MTTVCYKYRTAKSALKCLKSRSLWFAEPATLNDMLETRFDDASPEQFVEVMTQTLKELGEPRREFDESSMMDFANVNARENIRFRTFVDGMGIFSASTRADHQALWAYYAEDYRGVCFDLEFDTDVLMENQLEMLPVCYRNEPRVLNRAAVLRAK